MLARFAPKVYADMHHKLEALYGYHGFSLNFPRSIYPAMTVNFGPRTVCVPHLNAANDAVNWCHISAYGRFNSQLGGHVLLLKPRMAVEFPAGAHAFIPSALFPHANVDIQPGEIRQSFTQYCAGGLLRWVDCGFRTVKTLEAENPAAYEEYVSGLLERTLARVDLFSTLESVDADWEALRQGQL